jgi:alpha-tubulin suppressor-like RCC1 family protein
LFENEKIEQISAGFFHILLLRKNGEVLVCGINRFGQLETGDNEIRINLLF